jgi:transposase InsO family protein
VACNFTTDLQDAGRRLRFIVRDQETKFTAFFDKLFRAIGISAIRTPVRPPANAICERAIGTIRRECLDRMLILGRRHLEAVLAEYVEHYNAHRPHRSLSQRPPADSDATPPTIGDVDAARLRRTDRLGGLIHEYRIVA